jgi:hypothetical protein
MAGAQKTIGGMSKGMLALGAAGAAAIAGIGVAAARMVKIYGEQADAQAKLAGVLKATGNAAGFTAAQLEKEASALQSVTRFGDEAIINMQAILATFREVKGDEFGRATELILDMSSALGTDLKSSAIQVGKALNDPAKGVTALTRSGITFTEQQKDQIKHFQETNQLAKAQTVILDELANQFGGVSRAMAATPTGRIQQLANSWGDVKEGIGLVISEMLLLNGSTDDYRNGLDNLSEFIKSSARDWGTQWRVLATEGRFLWDTFQTMGETAFEVLIASAQNLWNTLSGQERISFAGIMDELGNDLARIDDERANRLAKIQTDLIKRIETEHRNQVKETESVRRTEAKRTAAEMGAARAAPFIPEMNMAANNLRDAVSRVSSASFQGPIEKGTVEEFRDMWERTIGRREHREPEAMAKQEDEMVNRGMAEIRRRMQRSRDEAAMRALEDAKAERAAAATAAATKPDIASGKFITDLLKEGAKKGIGPLTPLPTGPFTRREGGGAEVGFGPEDIVPEKKIRRSFGLFDGLLGSGDPKLSPGISELRTPDLGDVFVPGDPKLSTGKLSGGTQGAKAAKEVKRFGTKVTGGNLSGGSQGAKAAKDVKRLGTKVTGLLDDILREIGKSALTVVNAGL